MLTILRIIAVIIGSVIVLLLFVLASPVSARVEYIDGKLRVYPEIWFVKINLYKDKSLKNRKRKEKKKISESNNKTEKSRKMSLADIVETARVAGKAAVKLFKRITVCNISVRIIVCGDDPSETGIAVGEMWAVTGVVTSVVNNLFRARYESVEIVPDFDQSLSDEDLVRIGFDVKTRVIFLAVAGMVFLKNMH